MEHLKIRDWRVGVAVGVFSAVVLHLTFPILLFLAFAVVFVVLGALLALFPGQYSRRPRDTFPALPKPNIEATLSRVKVYPPPVLRPTLLTASVDGTLQEIMELTLKHHVIPTYKAVARDEEPFFHSVTPVVWTTLLAVTQRASHVDMMKMTQDVVKALRSHFEHFRGIHYQQVLAQFPQLSLYPYLKSPEHELNFLRQASEVLLCVALPKEHLQCTPIRVLIREYLAGQILLPTIEMVCDPDYINQKLLAYLTKREQAVKSASKKYHSRTFEDFVKNIKKIDDLMELHEMRQFIITDILQAKAVQKMKSTKVKGLGGGALPIPVPAEKARSLMERDLRVYVTQLETAKTVCERQIRKLGGEDYEASSTDPSQATNEKAYEGAEKSISLLPFDVIMNNTIAQGFFCSFLSECGYAHLLQFWGDVKKLDPHHLDTLHKQVKEILHRYLITGATCPLFPEEEKVAQIQARLEGQVAECVPLLLEIQTDVYLELQESFYMSFTCSGNYRDLLQEMIGAAEGESSPELLELGKFSDAVPRDAAAPDPTSDDSRYRIKLETLKMELEEMEDKIAAMPENVSTGSLAQRKKALNKDRVYLNDEIKKLEHYIDHTEEWFGTIGKWTVEVHSVDVKRENEKDPLFVIVVHRPQLSLKQRVEEEEEEEEEMGEDEMVEGERYSSDHWALQGDMKQRGSESPLLSQPRAGSTSPHKHRSGSAGSEGDTSYDVVDEMDEALRRQQQAGWVVGRHFSDFEQLHSKVSEITPALQLPPIPKRLNPFHKPDSNSKYWQKYMLALQSYLLQILRDLRLQECEEVFNFLSPASENLRQSSLIHPERKRFSISVPLFSKEEEDSTITEHMYALMSEIFELDEWSRVLRKQLMDLVQLTYGKNIHRSVQESINWVVSEPMLGFYLETFRDAMWPGGVPAPPAPIRSDEQKQLTKYEAKKKFLKSSPQGIQTILGQRNCQIGFQKIFEALQDPRANKQLFYSFFELLLYALVPELETVEIEDTVADWKAEY